MSVLASELASLVREFLDAECDASSEPCLHRYRGAVRTREVARRRKRRSEALNALMAGVGYNPWAVAHALERQVKR